MLEGRTDSYYISTKYAKKFTVVVGQEPRAPDAIHLSGARTPYRPAGSPQAGTRPGGRRAPGQRGSIAAGEVDR